MTNLRKVLASNMKLYRKNLGFSQAKLAEIIDISDNYIALIESGRRFPSIKILEKIAEALNIDTLELFLINPAKLTENKNLKKAILADIEQILAVRLNENRS